MRPTNFQPSEFTQQDNHFMGKKYEHTPEQIKDLANEEHRAFEKKTTRSQHCPQSFRTN